MRIDNNNPKWKDDTWNMKNYKIVIVTKYFGGTCLGLIVEISFNVKELVI